MYTHVQDMGYESVEDCERYPFISAPLRHRLNMGLVEKAAETASRDTGYYQIEER